MIIILCFLKIPRHFNSRVVVPTLDIKRFILCAAIKNVLVAAEVLGDGVEGVEHGEAEVFALVGVGDCYFFYVAYEAAVVDALSGLLSTRYIWTCHKMWIDEVPNTTNRYIRKK